MSASPRASGAERRADALRELVDREGLLQELERVGVRAALGDDVARVARHEEARTPGQSDTTSAASAGPVRSGITTSVSSSAISSACCAASASAALGVAAASTR